jgi:non-heme chloroperoxidase
MEISREHVKVDGVRLAFLEAGAGRPLVLLHGWSQSAAQFEPLMIRLAAGRRVIALDHRGHGASEDPGRGYRIERLAADVRSVLAALALDEVALVGHSMSVAVIGAYVDVYGTERIDRLVLNDQRPRIVRPPDWSDDEALRYGASVTPEAAADFSARLAGPESEVALAAAMRSMVTPDLPPERFAALMATTAMPRPARAALYWSMVTADLRDVWPAVDVPTLVTAGEASMIPVECQRWLASEIPGAEFHVTRAAHGGSHFAFWEDPDRYAAVLAEFLER